jgi:hypothetical protein
MPTVETQNNKSRPTRGQGLTVRMWTSCHCHRWVIENGWRWDFNTRTCGSIESMTVQSLANGWVKHNKRNESDWNYMDTWNRVEETRDRQNGEGFTACFLWNLVIIHRRLGWFVIDSTGALTLVRGKCLKGENISHISAKYLREEHLIARLATAGLTIRRCDTEPFVKWRPRKNIILWLRRSKFVRAMDQFLNELEKSRRFANFVKNVGNRTIFRE